jgi:hypothetical protein
VTGPRHTRWWTLAVWGLLVLAAVAGEPRSAGEPDRHPPPPASAGLAGTNHAALLPVRLPDDVRIAAQAGASSRALVLAAALAAILGLPALYPRHGSAGERGRRQLQARRYAIALRAPPLRLA